MSAESRRERVKSGRLAGTFVMTAVVTAIAWSAPKVLGREAGLTSCVILIAAGATLAALAVGGTRRLGLLCSLSAASVIALACMGSAAHVPPP